MSKSIGFCDSVSLISPFSLTVTAATRAGLKAQKPRCIWLTGLSAAGKTTLANGLEVELVKRGQHTFLLDGDNVRGGLCRDLGMSDVDRRENVRRIAEVAKLMVDAGLVVIVAVITPFSCDRKAIRALFNSGDLSFVYISTPFHVCAQRDPKGLYKAAEQGRIANFTGLGSRYEVPEDADCEISTEILSEAAALSKLTEFVLGV